MQTKPRTALKDGWQWFLSRASIELVLALCVIGMLYASFWHFDIIDLPTIQRAVLTTFSLLLVAKPLASTKSSLQQHLRPGWLMTGIFLFVFVAVIGKTRPLGWAYITTNTAGVLFSLPFLWAIIRLTSRRPLVILATAVHMGLAMAALAVSITPPEMKTSSILFYLPIIAIPAAGWSYLMRSTHRMARSFITRPIRGPLFEALFMAVVVLPAVALSIQVLAKLEVTGVWLTFLVVLIGLLFGNVVATPLRQCLLDLAHLSPHEERGCRCPEEPKIC